MVTISLAFGPTSAAEPKIRRLVLTTWQTNTMPSMKAQEPNTMFCWKPILKQAV